jgi:DNA-binding response OmpR family regulator
MARDVDRLLQRDVLIVSATPLIREVFHDVFLSAGYQCLLAADGSEAVDMFRGWRPSLVLTDFNLPDVSGLELLQDVRQEDPAATVIILCGGVFKRGGKVVGLLDVEAVRGASLKLGAYAVLEKPVGVEELLFTAEGALYSRQIARRERQVLERRWGAVRPIAAVSELLGAFAAVFTIPPRYEGDRRRPAELKRQ